jgi:hypothetical protein
MPPFLDVFLQDQLRRKEWQMQRKAHANPYAWLYAGVIATGAALGYMVGASLSPVVGAAIPGVFTVLVFGFEAINGLRRSDAPEKKVHEEAVPVLPLFFTPIGKLLTLFSIAYLGSMLIGTEVRTHALEHKETPFPWAGSKQPSSVEDALDWITVQSHLRDYGYSTDQIQQLYKIPRKNSDQLLSSYIPSADQTQQTGPLGLHVEPTKFDPSDSHAGVPISFHSRWPDDWPYYSHTDKQGKGDKQTKDDKQDQKTTEK